MKHEVMVVGSYMRRCEGVCMLVCLHEIRTKNYSFSFRSLIFCVWAVCLFNCILDTFLESIFLRILKR